MAEYPLTGDTGCVKRIGPEFHKLLHDADAFEVGILGRIALAEEAMRNNFFRRATENSEALAAYAKFLRHETLIETTSGFSADAFQDKMRRIQREFPGWVQKSGEHAQATLLTQKLSALVKERKFQEADKVADELLSLMPRAEKK